VPGCKDEVTSALGSSQCPRAGRQTGKHDGHAVAGGLLWTCLEVSERAKRKQVQVQRGSSPSLEKTTWCFPDGHCHSMKPMATDADYIFQNSRSQPISG
jgi:hypothetical protein